MPCFEHAQVGEGMALCLEEMLLDAPLVYGVIRHTGNGKWRGLVAQIEWMSIQFYLQLFQNITGCHFLKRQ